MKPRTRTEFKDFRKKGKKKGQNPVLPQNGEETTWRDSRQAKRLPNVFAAPLANRGQNLIIETCGLANFILMRSGANIGWGSAFKVAV